MTGGTLVLKKGTTYLMTKVSSDGMDLETNLTQIKTWATTPGAIPSDVATFYLRGRNIGDFDPWDVSDKKQIKDCMISRTYTHSPTCKDTLDLFRDELGRQAICDMMSDDYNEEHPYNQLACDYSDYVLFVDMDVKTFELNGELV